VTDELVNVRYMADAVEEAVAFYTTHFGFTVRSNYAPAFADVVRSHLRLLLSGPTSSAGRPMPDGRTPEPGGWNRIQSGPTHRHQGLRTRLADLGSVPRRRTSLPGSADLNGQLAQMADDYILAARNKIASAKRHLDALDERAQATSPSALRSRTPTRALSPAVSRREISSPRRSHSRPAWAYATTRRRSCLRSSRKSQFHRIGTSYTARRAACPLAPGRGDLTWRSKSTRCCWSASGSLQRLRVRYVKPSGVGAG
jgi:hypothetical protein